MFNFRAHSWRLSTTQGTVYEISFYCPASRVLYKCLGDKSLEVINLHASAAVTLGFIYLFILFSETIFERRTSFGSPI